MRDLLRRLASALTCREVRRRRAADRARVYRLGWSMAYRSAAAHILTGEHGAPRIGADREWAVHQWLAERAEQIERVDRG